MTDEMDGENDTCLGVEAFEGADEPFVEGRDVEGEEVLFFNLA